MWGMFRVENEHLFNTEGCVGGVGWVLLHALTLPPLAFLPRLLSGFSHSFLPSLPAARYRRVDFVPLHFESPLRQATGHRKTGGSIVTEILLMTGVVVSLGILAVVSQ